MVCRRLPNPLRTRPIRAWLRVGAAVLAAALAAPAANAGKVLNMYNWSDYIAPTTIPNFERQTGIKVRYDTFDTNETLFAKLITGDSGYDIVVPTVNWAAIDIRGGLLHPLDKSKIPNLRNLDPQLMRLVAQLDPGNKYLVPWMWGYVTVGINEDKVRKALGRTPLPDNPWDLVFNPRYTDRLKSCGISFLDSGGDLMEAAFNDLGIPQTSSNPEDFLRAFAMLHKVRPDITEFSSSGYINDLAGGSICVALGYSGDMGIAAHRAAQAHNGQHIKVFPPTHGAVIMIDTMAIPATAKNLDEAYAFINYRLQPQVCADDSNTVYYANPVPASRPMLASQVTDNDYIYPSPALMRKLIAPKVYTAEERHAVTRLYTRLRTGL